MQHNDSAPFQIQSLPAFVSYKLFIPGPVAVSEKTYRAMAQPMIPHRSPEFVALYRSIQTGLQTRNARRHLSQHEQFVGRDGGSTAQRR